MGEEEREMYDYSYGSDTITIIIGEERDIYEGEGIQQHVEILVNFTSLYNTNFGREHTLSMFNEKKDYSFFSVDMIVFKNNEMHLLKEHDEYIVFNDAEYILFMEWVSECLTPLSTKRRVKIDKLKSIIKEKNV